MEKGDSVPEFASRLIALPFKKDGYKTSDNVFFTKSEISPVDKRQLVKSRRWKVLQKSDGFQFVQAEAINKADFPGTKIGTTKTGKNIMSHGRPISYHNFSHKDHQDAVNAHYDTAMKTSNNTIKMHHMRQAKDHMKMAAQKEPKPLAPQPAPKPQADIPYGRIPGKGRGEPKGF